MPENISLNPSIAIIAAGVIVAGAILYTSYNPPVPTANDQQLTTNVTPPQVGEHRYGSLDAAITLIEYSDFECPFCARVNPTLKRLVDEGGGEVAWVYRHLPLESIHKEARPAALASECLAEQLGDEGFWKFAGRIFEDQSKMSAQYYRELAQELGADAGAFSACVASEKYGAKVDADTQEAYANGATGTPFTVVYGHGRQVSVSGALPYAQFLAVINALKERQ